MDSKLLPDHDFRLRISQDVIKHLSAGPAPPPGFNNLKATNTDLLKYGLPVRPDKTNNPRLRAKWERAMSRPLKFVPPTVKINNIVHPPKSAGTGGSAGAINNNIWSGAVITQPPPGKKFDIISASWIVPNAYPPQSAKVGNGWKDGTYQSWAWIGIDGWNTSGVLQTGTASYVTVANGQITQQGAYPWFEWFPALEMAFTDLTVKPGDVVSAVVCGAAGSTSGFVGLTNVSSGQATSTTIPSPKLGIAVQGLTAEWVMEDPSYANLTPQPFADYGATFFYDTIASSVDSTGSQESDLTSATLINMTTTGTASGVEESTALIENHEVLMVYAFNHNP